MTKTNKQLETVFQELREHFADIPEITVTPGKGSPPEEYSVTYHTKGACKKGDGEITICDKHVVLISLPFNFPQFPPNCRPQSPTFHPDFDPSAICIDDVWEADKSMVKLILHMGWMIAGEIYSEVNAFNEEAAEWYKANSDSLPFTEPRVKEEIEPPALDDVASPPPSASGASKAAKEHIDAESLRLMAVEMRYYALSRELKTIEESFSGRAELEEETESVLNKASSLFSEASSLEQKGKHRQALEKLNLIETLVVDSPQLHEEKNRVQQAFDLLGDWVEGNEDIEHDRDAPPLDDSTSLEQETAEADISDTIQPDPVGTKPTPRSSEKLTFYDETKQKEGPSKGLLVTGGVVILALLITLAGSYLFLGSGMGKAEKRYAECQELLNANKFSAAEKKCREALDIISDIPLVKQGKKRELSGQIRSLLDSPQLEQGLAGKTLFDGKYVFQADRELIMAFREAKKSGDAFFAKEQWLEAERSYNKALQIAKKTEIEADLLGEIRSRQPRARYNGITQAGKKALAVSDWSEAQKYFSEAVKLAKEDPQFKKEDLAQLELLSNRAEFNNLRTRGHDFFKNGEWSKALENYQRALAMAEKLNPLEPETISSLHENIARTEIYLAIEKGKKAFAASQWDTVIVQHEKAIRLLEENSTLLSEINTEESGDKLARIMLHAAILRDKQEVARHLKAEEYAQAVEQLQKIKKAITTSKFADNQEFQTILKEISSQIGDTRKQALVIKLAAYLTDNYEKLFLKHYPAATRSVLSAPTAEYLKDKGSKMLFRMQCTETAGGRPLRLQMDYLYSPANGSWRFYSETE